MFDETIAKIGSSLEKCGIPYMIIGGQAVLLYGEPRLTRDIDITLGVNIDHLNTVLGMIRQLDIKPLVEDIETFARKTMVLPALDEATGIRVDFIFSFTPYEAQAIGRARKVRILDHDVRFAAIEDLIIHKIFAGRPRDIEDVRSILMKGHAIDSVYIEAWLREFDAATEGKKLLDAFQNISC